jgi:hypothetical protein
MVAGWQKPELPISKTKAAFIEISKHRKLQFLLKYHAWSTDNIMAGGDIMPDSQYRLCKP